MKTRFCLIALLLAGCAPSADEAGQISESPSPSEIEVPAERIPLVVGGVPLYMDAYLNRNFWQSTDGAAMTGKFVVTSSIERFPAGITGDIVWLKNKAQSWSANVTDVAYLNATLGVGIWGGPKWDVGTKADIKLRIFDQNKVDYFIETRGVLIHESY